MSNDEVTVVLVHGAFHGAWCWDRLVPALAARGVEAEAVELPFTSLADDAATVAAAIEKIDGPVLAVGHSYGGAVITGGAEGADHLLYLAALMPDPELPVVLEASPAMGGIRAGEDGFAYFDPELAVDCFYHRSSPEDAKWAVSHMRSMPVSTMSSSMQPEAVAWRKVPSTYVVCTDDRSINPDGQRELFAPRAGRTIEIDSDHSPFLCKVDELADVVADIARQIGA